MRGVKRDGRAASVEIDGAIARARGRLRHYSDDEARAFVIAVFRAAGMTDLRIARVLNVTDRTVRRVARRASADPLAEGPDAA